MITLRTFYKTYGEWRERAISRYNRRKAIKNLTKHNLYMAEVERLLEEWVAKIILDGELGPQEIANERNELLKKQYAIKRIRLFLDYLKQVR